MYVVRQCSPERKRRSHHERKKFNIHAPILHIKRYHLPPVAAAVSAPVPLVHGMPDAFGPQDMAQVLVVAEKRILFTDGEHYVHPA